MAERCKQKEKPQRENDRACTPLPGISFGSKNALTDCYNRFKTVRRFFFISRSFNDFFDRFSRIPLFDSKYLTLESSRGRFTNWPITSTRLVNWNRVDVIGRRFLIYRMWLADTLAWVSPRPRKTPAALRCKLTLEKGDSSKEAHAARKTRRNSKFLKLF